MGRRGEMERGRVPTRLQSCFDHCEQGEADCIATRQACSAFSVPALRISIAYTSACRL